MVRRLVVLALMLALAAPVLASGQKCGCCRTDEGTAFAPAVPKGCCEVKPEPRPAPEAAQPSRDLSPSRPDGSKLVAVAPEAETIRSAPWRLAPEAPPGGTAETPPPKYLRNCAFLI